MLEGGFSNSTEQLQNDNSVKEDLQIEQSSHKMKCEM